jgi:hypothetical protein
VHAQFSRVLLFFDEDISKADISDELLYFALQFIVFHAQKEESLWQDPMTLQMKCLMLCRKEGQGNATREKDAIKIKKKQSHSPNY